MNNLTKMSTLKPAHEAFEAFVDPGKIGNFWFSSSSGRWEAGKTFTLRYDEYQAQVEIAVKEVAANEKILFQWGGEANTVTILFRDMGDSRTIVEINEEGFDENDPELLHKMIGNKEGWVYVLTCLKGYLEFGINRLRAGIVMD
ncbi:SRPBCC family protein [Paenibacillus aestuarii]|uniref:SRPBCC family protein n=1 Tax=Paenibacillus aestuarii TaxID=516965 RepID=A0ABW0KD55_9BACL|nr:SRPBCC family protein [Paenibacillus aestuarii]